MDRRTEQAGWRRERTVEAVASFTALMHAYEVGELITAAEAQHHLDRLGIVVRFARPQAKDRKGVSGGA